MTQTQADRDVKEVVKRFREQTRTCRRFLSTEVEEALVAKYIMELMMIRAEGWPDKPMGPYVDVHRRACKALLIETWVDWTPEAPAND